MLQGGGDREHRFRTNGSGVGFPAAPMIPDPASGRQLNRTRIAEGVAANRQRSMAYPGRGGRAVIEGGSLRSGAGGVGATVLTSERGLSVRVQVVL